MSDNLESAVIVLIAAVSAVLLILCFYLAAALKEAAAAAKSIKELSDLARQELEPAMKSVNNVLKTADNVSSGLNRINKIPIAALGLLCGAAAALKGKGGFLSGLASGFSMTNKKRR